MRIIKGAEMFEHASQEAYEMPIHLLIQLDLHRRKLRWYPIGDERKRKARILSEVMTIDRVAKGLTWGAELWK